MRLGNNVAVITGGASGMGKAISLLFAKEGATVAVADIDGAKAASVAQTILETGGAAVAIPVDVTKEQEVRALVSVGLSRFNRIDILVNCAGIAEYIPAEEISSDQWQRMLNVDLSGIFYCCREVGREMIKRKRGKIINFSSTAGLAGIPSMAHYCAAKHGVVGLTKALAVEWGKYNVNVNCICPGATLTPLLLGATTESHRNERARKVPLQRLATPEDQAQVALFLASSESDYVSGGVLCVDGGIFALAASTSESAFRAEK